MRKFFFYCVLVLAITSMPIHVIDAAESWSTFRGAWFTVDYPTEFNVVPSLKSHSADGYDSAHFTSPDNSVAFYVFAPQWTGDELDIAVDPAVETLVAESSEHSGNVVITWRTIAAKDGSYQRSYQSTSDRSGPTRWTIGIRYADSGALERWREVYDKFKGSLRLFAD